MTPLILIVGFLGSGKTTFLKNLIPALAAQKIRPGLLINDYQNAQVDASQFTGLVEQARAVDGDCVCCGSRDQLREELQAFDHQPGRVMIVETNGTTDAELLIETLALDPSLQRFTLPVQLSIVDTQRWQKRFWHNRLEREQLRTASHIYLSRKDIVSKKRLEEVHNSFAVLQMRGKLTDVKSFASELAAMAQNTLPHRLVINASRRHHHEGMHSEHHFASCEFTLPARISKTALQSFLRGLPPEVIRAKGLVILDETPNEFFVFQKVDQSEELQLFPVGNNLLIKTPLALFIGVQLPIEDLEAKIHALAASKAP